MARHAIAAEDKLARREAILAAAAALFGAGDGGLPSAAEIAAASGLAKGTVYLYFRTKEEIFVALLLQRVGALLGEMADTVGRARGRRTDKVADLIRTYVAHLGRHPELLRLDAIGYGVLETNLEPVKLRAFKLTFVEKLTGTATCVEQALHLPAGRGFALLMRTFALTRGLWQSAHPHGQATAIRAEPGLAALYPDFAHELLDALGEYWRGALSAG